MDSNFWVFLCFGQSNMAGQAPIEEQDLAVSDRFLSMATTDGADRKLGTWRKAVPPLCRADANLGPADWFGLSYHILRQGQECDCHCLG